MTESVRIRSATRDDCDAMVAMLIRLADEIDERDRFRCRSEDLAEHGFSNLPLFECLLAERDGENLGLALFFAVFSTIRGQPGVYLQDLWVDAAARDAGIGERLLHAVAATATRRWQAGYLELMVHADNPAALRFYRRLGLAVRAGEEHLCVDGAAFDALCRHE